MMIRICRTFVAKIKKLDNRGMGTVEMILIIVVLIGLVVFFKTQINLVLQDIFTKITSRTGVI